MHPLIASGWETLPWCYDSLHTSLCVLYSWRWVARCFFAICLGSSPHQWYCSMPPSHNALQFFPNSFTLLVGISTPCPVSFPLFMFLIAVSISALVISVMSSSTSACHSFLPSLGVSSFTSFWYSLNPPPALYLLRRWSPLPDKCLSSYFHFFRQPYTVFCPPMVSVSAY